MGGSGSGRWYRSSGATCEDYHSIDVCRLARGGYLEPGRAGWWRWSRGDEETGSIRFRADHGCLVLMYRTRPWGDDWEDVEQRISLCYSTPHFGGARPWFVCPNCYRRCGKLYGGSRFFCRKCWGLAYESQRERPHDRMLRRVQSLRMRLGGSPSMDDPFPEKPKGMQWRTYNRLRWQHDALEDAMNGALLEWIGCKFGRYLF